MSEQGPIEQVLRKRIGTADHGKETIEVAEYEIERIIHGLERGTSLIKLASAIYRRSLEEDFIQNRTVGQVAGAATYAAYRIEGEATCISEIAEIALEEEKEINRTFAELSRQLNLRAGPIEPQKFIPRFCKELELSEEVADRATELIDASEKEGLVSGRSPAGIAAGSVYAASLLCAEFRTQHQVADATNVSISTIRNRYQEQLGAAKKISDSNNF